MKRARSAQNNRRLHATQAAAPDAGGGGATISVPVLPPRNPYATLARQRKAGAHDADARKRRRLEKKALHQKLHDA